MKFLSFCNTIIIWSFYSLFFFVPIVFTGDTSELFEFNKMWLTFGIAGIIVAAWISKMIAERHIRILRTPLDIPILLFLLSQIIATIHSLDPYISWWGYYSRFNGGLLSTITYIFFYYAFVSHVTKKQVLRVLHVSLWSGLFVSLWGLPAHFGYDPTCYIFRGTLDVSCWTDAFQPKARIFSTMGQPDWLAAYLLLLVPVAIAFGINAWNKRKLPYAISYTVLAILFYIDFLYTRSKGSFVSFVIPMIFFIPAYIWFTRTSLKKAQYFLGILLILAACTFFIGTSIPQVDRFTLTQLMQKFSQPQSIHQTTKQAVPAHQPKTPSIVNPITGEIGGTDSGKIRLFVWKGALEIWKHNILFGTGVETFAFAYYQFRPAGHNLTSEWDYLYNKAHNEYLNYLATTGAFGLLTYLSFICMFLFLTFHFLWKKRSQNVMTEKRKSQDSTPIGEIVLVLGLFISFLTILISNFFGFSVVIVNEYFFLIPAFFLLLTDQLKPEKSLLFPRTATRSQLIPQITVGQWLCISMLWLICVYWIAILINYWNADKAYGLGSNLDKAGQYQSAYGLLHQAVAARPDEPTFQDELTINDAALALTYASQKETTNAGKRAQEAIQTSNDLMTNHPNDIVFLKTRTRVMYTLSEIDSRYLPYALEAIEKAHMLAPTDAKVSYNLGLLYSQNNQMDKAIATLRQTLQLKKDYRDAYYALAVVLHQQAVDKNNSVIHPEEETEAEANLEFILHTLSPSDKQSQDLLKSWTHSGE